MRAKRALAVAAAITVMLLCSCLNGTAQNGLELNKDKSRFDDFSVISNMVYMDCFLTIDNKGTEDVTVKISASSQKDVSAGLLKCADMCGFDEKLVSDTFVLSSGENSLVVVFEGEFGGTEQKKDRLLPEDIQIEVVS